MSVSEYAASQMRYWCDTNDFGGIGYSQANRWSAYDASDWDGWLRGPGESDCSAGVAGAWNIAFHHEKIDVPLFPRDSYTGNLIDYALQRGFVDISDSWTGNIPDGGFRHGDLLFAPGHVVMMTDPNPDYPYLSEFWIDAAGDILGSDGADGSSADNTGGESRTIAYFDHPYTQRALWTACISYRGPSAPDELSSSEDIALLGEIRNALRYGKANSHPAGDVIWASDAIRHGVKAAGENWSAIARDVAEIKEVCRG